MCACIPKKKEGQQNCCRQRNNRYVYECQIKKSGQNCLKKTLYRKKKERGKHILQGYIIRKRKKTIRNSHTTKAIRNKNLTH